MEVDRVPGGASLGIKRYLFRVIRVVDGATYDGWCWLEGYELDSAGEAVDRRQVFVHLAALRLVRAAAPRPRNER